MPVNPLWSQLGWQGPHPGHLGGLLSDQPVIIHEPNLVAYVTNISAYPMGLLFTVDVEQALEDGPLSSAQPDVEVRFSVDPAVQNGPPGAGYEPHLATLQSQNVGVPAPT